MSHRLCPPAHVVGQPKIVYKDVYHPQLVKVIHPVEIVIRHHCVPIHEHIHTCVVKNEFCCPVSSSASVANVRGKKKRVKI
jgi:hypothetical protein